MKLIEKTPKLMICQIGTCPAVFETDNNTYIVVGKKVKIGKKHGKNEEAIEVPKKLFIELK